MAGFGIRQFKGRAPRVAPRLLPDQAAQTATNVYFKRGTLVPLKGNTTILTLPKSPVASIFRYGQGGTDPSQYWFNWTSDVNVCRGFIAGDTYERVYYTGDSEPRMTYNAIATGANMPVTYRTLGVPYPASAPTINSLTGTPDPDALPETRVYVVTCVSNLGEESAPSDASASTAVTIGQTVNLGIPATPAGSYNITAKRIYRSVTGSGGTPYLFVAEIAAATTAYADSLTADQLGEELPSLDYEQPPATMKGLTAGPNGVMAGFTGKDVYFCEPYMPHAWPSKYVLTTDSDVVGIGVIDTTWVILTKTVPYLIQGTHPDSYAMTKSDLQQACLSKRSIVSADGGVVYASPDGLFMVGGGSSRNLTEAILTRLDWQALNPASLHGVVVDNQYIGFYNGTAGFIFDLQTGDWTDLDFYARATYYDAALDTLFLVTGTSTLASFNTASTTIALSLTTLTGNSSLSSAVTATPHGYAVGTPFLVTISGASVASFNGKYVATSTGASSFTYASSGTPSATGATASFSWLRVTTWKSKTFYTPTPFNLGAARVEASGPVTFNIYADAMLVHTQTVTDANAFRLPSGFLASEWEFEVTGAYEVYSVTAAQSIAELQGG